MHEKLSLIIIGPPSPYSAILDDRLERIRIPLIERFRRLNVIVTIYQYGICLRVNDFLPIHHRISHGFTYPGFIGTGLHEKIGQRFRTEIHVSLVLLLRTYGRDAENSEQFFEESLLVLFDIFFHTVYQLCDYLSLSFNPDRMVSGRSSITADSSPAIQNPHLGHSPAS